MENIKSDANDSILQPLNTLHPLLNRSTGRDDRATGNNGLGGNDISRMRHKLQIRRIVISKFYNI